MIRAKSLKCIEILCTADWSDSKSFITIWCCFWKKLFQKVGKIKLTDKTQTGFKMSLGEQSWLTSKFCHQNIQPYLLSRLSFFGNRFGSARIKAFISFIGHKALCQSQYCYTMRQLVSLSCCCTIFQKSKNSKRKRESGQLWLE